jgi:hypothetical protein
LNSEVRRTELLVNERKRVQKSPLIEKIAVVVYEGFIAKRSAAIFDPGEA